MHQLTVDVPVLLDAQKSGARVVDVRTPSEFASGHIPGAVNIPLFSDDERAEVGTLYHRQGRVPAIRRGLQLVRRNLKPLTDRVATLLGPPEPDGALVMHCWRGGMRSHSMAWLVRSLGYDVRTLAGGYKAWRRWVHSNFERPWPLVVLSGLTGCGKTRLLYRLAELGEAVVDLEGLANHRGSAFGGVGKGAQPTVEQFENELALALVSHRGAARIWVEDESHSIGKVVLPHAFHLQLRAAPAVFLEVPVEVRRQLIVQEYGGHSREELTACIHKIAKRLGGQNVIAAGNALLNGDMLTCTNILLDYYDRTYRNAMTSPSRQVRGHTVPLSTDRPDCLQTAREVIALADRLAPFVGANAISDCGSRSPTDRLPECRLDK